MSNPDFPNFPKTFCGRPIVVIPGIDCVIMSPEVLAAVERLAVPVELAKCTVCGRKDQHSHTS